MWVQILKILLLGLKPISEQKRVLRALRLLKPLFLSLSFYGLIKG